MALAWYIDGKNLKEYGITVSGSIGLVDGLQMKSPFKVDLPDYHGEIVDLEKPRYEPRDITLNCWIKAFGMLDFAIKVNTFIQSIKGDGTHRFMIEIDPNRPLVYEVYFPDKTAIDKTWNDSTMIGTFSIKMRESEPIKKILSFITPRYGGVNLLRNTNFPSGVSYWMKTGSVNMYPTPNVKPPGSNNNTLYIESDKVGSGTNNILTQPTKRLEVGKTYTLSFWAAIHMQSGNLHFEVWGGIGSTDFAVPSGWRFYTHTFTVTKDNPDQSLYFWINKAGAFYLNSIQLEEGNTATAWKPAPEDVPDGATINISTDKLVNIHWGDGSHDYDVFGDNIVLKHPYTKEGIYFIVISGVIEEIKSLSTNATVIWNVI